MESEKDTKILVDDKSLGVFARPFVEKHFKVATPNEDCFIAAKQEVKKIISSHLQDAKRCTELFDQFSSVISGSLSTRVLESFSRDYPEYLYTDLVKELRFYHSLAL